VESYPYRVKEGQQYINQNRGRLFVQQLPRCSSIVSMLPVGFLLPHFLEEKRWR